MKTVILALILAASAWAQTEKVEGTITVTATGGKVTTYTIVLPATAVQAMDRHLAATADTKDDGTKEQKYPDPGALVIGHLNESLIVPLVVRYPPAAVATAAAAEEAAKAAKDAEVAKAAAGTITVR